MGQNSKVYKIDLLSVAVSSICAAIIIFGLYESVLGWLQLLKYQPSNHALFPATGTFYNPGPYCGFLAVIVPLATSFVINRHPKPVQILSVAYIIIALSLMPSLMGRTGWIAAFAGGLFILIVYRKIHIYINKADTCNCSFGISGCNSFDIYEAGISFRSIVFMDYRDVGRLYKSADRQWFE